MLRSRQDIQISWRYRSRSPLQLPHNNKRLVRCKIDPQINDPEHVDRNNVGQASAVNAFAPQCTNKPPTLISTELPQFEAEDVQNRSGRSTCVGFWVLLDLFKLFLNILVAEIVSSFSTQHSAPDTYYSGMNLHISWYTSLLWPMSIRSTRWLLVNLQAGSVYGSQMIWANPSLL